MKRKILNVIVVIIATITGYNTFTLQKEVKLTDLALANVEALAGGEAGLGCGRAAYEWDEEWFQDELHFYTCEPGCPERVGSSPKFRECD